MNQVEFRYQSGDSTHVVSIERDGDEYRASVGGRSYHLELLRSAPAEFTLRLDGRRLTAHVAADGPRRWVALGGQTFVLSTMVRAARRSRGHDGGEALTAVMPGQVRAVAVVEGQVVDKGQTLVILEAMKMEIRVTAPHAGRVQRLLVHEGQVVERGQALVEVVGNWAADS